MILLFSSSDFPSAIVTKLSRKLRADGFLLCLPQKALSLEKLAAIPFSAAVLCMARKTDGLPSVTELRTVFPQIRLLVLSRSNPSCRWRSIPGTDAELTSPYSFTEISTVLENFGALHFHAQNTIHRYGIELTPDRHTVMLGVKRVSLTPAQHTILHLLIRCPDPTEADVIASFLRCPRHDLPTNSIPIHIHNLNSAAQQGNIPRMVGHIYRKGYSLLPPYGRNLS
ncbi:MAG: hypothetical protein IJZ02_06675 [Clostridia bacterium]|nr:hypothetical protein [Clostridia bacterium]